MARSMWNGAITLGGLVVPVKVFTATSPQTVHFRELHAKDGAPLEHRRVSSKTGKEVPAERTVKGYETSPGRWVVLTDDEIKAVEQPRRRAIEIEHFVPSDQIDPAHYDRAYYLGVGDEAGDAYATFARALERSGRVGIGRVVLRNRERLVAVRAVDGLLRMSTMRFADELVPAADLDVDRPRKAPSRREIEMAETLVEGLVEEFVPGAYEDTHRERLLDYLRARARGEAPEPPADEEREADPDLMAALRASLEKAAA